MPCSHEEVCPIAASPPPYPRPSRACLHHPSHRPNPTRIASRSTRCTEVCLTASSKLLVLGAPGIGKTAMVNMVARTLAAHPAAISDCNGREVGLDLVRDWLRSISQSSLFGRWQVKVVNELNRCSRDAQHPHEEVCPITHCIPTKRSVQLPHPHEEVCPITASPTPYPRRTALLSTRCPATIKTDPRRQLELTPDRVVLRGGLGALRHVV